MHYSRALVRPVLSLSTSDPLTPIRAALSSGPNLVCMRAFSGQKQSHLTLQPCDRMQSHAIACNCVQSHVIALCTVSAACAIACNRVQFHAIARDCMRSHARNALRRCSCPQKALIVRHPETQRIYITPVYARDPQRKSDDLLKEPA